MAEYGLTGFLTPEAAKKSAAEHGYPDAEILGTIAYAWYFDDGMDDGEILVFHRRSE